MAMAAEWGPGRRRAERALDGKEERRSVRRDDPPRPAGQGRYQGDRIAVGLKCVVVAALLGVAAEASTPSTPSTPSACNATLLQGWSAGASILAQIASPSIDACCSACSLKPE